MDTIWQERSFKVKTRTILGVIQRTLCPEEGRITEYHGVPILYQGEVIQTKKYSLNKASIPLRGLVVAHAAHHGASMAIFGRHYIKRLVQEGVDLHFFASNVPFAGMAPPIDELEGLGGRFHGLMLPERFTPIQAIQNIIQMAILLRRYRVQVLHTRLSIMGGIGRIAGKLARVPVIIHHQDDLYCRDTRLSPLMKWVWAFIETQLSKLADKSLFVSKAVLNDALAIGFREDRCVLVGHDLHEVFQNAVNESEGGKEPVLSRLLSQGVPDNAQIVGCVGRLTYHKGIDLLVAAAEKLAPAFPGWVFVIKGDGQMRESIKNLIRQKGLSAKIFLLTEELPIEELPTLYRCFDIFALPTRREGFGMVFAEAMAMGVPVVGPRMAPVTEVVPKGCGILVEPENVGALVSALGELMVDESLQTKIAEKGKKHALATWCGNKSAERVIDVYQESLSRRGGTFNNSL